MPPGTSSLATGQSCSHSIPRGGGEGGWGEGGKGEEGDPACTPLSSWITPPSAPLMELSKSKLLDAVTMATFPSILSSPPPQNPQPSRIGVLLMPRLKYDTPCIDFYWFEKTWFFVLLYCIGENSQDKEFNSYTVWGTLRATCKRIREKTFTCRLIWGIVMEQHWSVIGSHVL